MFEDDENIEVIPITLLIMTNYPKNVRKITNIRVIEMSSDIYDCFKDYRYMFNNLWIALETIIKSNLIFRTKYCICMSLTYPYGKNITNLGSCYTNNFNQQVTFANSDYVVLISKAEEDYYKQFGYDMFDTKTCVIYNSYQPKV